MKTILRTFAVLFALSLPGAAQVALPVGPGAVPQVASVLQVSLASNMSVTDATNTVVKFDTVEIDTQSGYATGSGRYTPKRSGSYLVCTTLQASVVTLIANVQVYISKNGLVQSPATRLQVGPFSAASGQLSQMASGCRILSMNGTTDTVEIDTSVTGTGGSDAVVGGSFPYTTMTISYLGL